MEEDRHISLNKYISDSGLCSRREADRLIDAGRVMLNGEVAKKGNRVMAGDVVLLDGSPVLPHKKTVYILYNKPEGIVCTTDIREPDNIISHLAYEDRIFPVGRLDKMSGGLILLTNDGDIVNRILRAENHHEKEYIVTVNKTIDDRFVKTMMTGVPILNTVTRPCKVRMLDNNTFSIILTQGLNRQIRRMCEYLGYRVISLRRVRIMHLQAGDLAMDTWRYLTADEEKELLRLTFK